MIKADFGADFLKKIIETAEKLGITPEKLMSYTIKREISREIFEDLVNNNEVYITLNQALMQKIEVDGIKWEKHSL